MYVINVECNASTGNDTKTYLYTDSLNEADMIVKYLNAKYHTHRYTYHSAVRANIEKIIYDNEPQLKPSCVEWCKIKEVN